MATVNVTSWTEFLEAAAVSGDTVVCPENAVWDLADLEPEGHSGTITIKSDIVGNGTTIKNLVQSGLGTSGSPFTISGGSTSAHRSISGINILNATITSRSDALVFLFKGNWVDFELCQFSMLARGLSQICGEQGSMYRCAANIELTTSGSILIGGNGETFDYCNFKFSGSGVGGFRTFKSGYDSQRATINNSYIILDTPQITTIAMKSGVSNVFRCTGANVTSLSGYTASNFSLGVDTDFPNVTTVSSGWVLVSENQLRDAAYLQSIGFPIGV